MFCFCWLYLEVIYFCLILLLLIIRLPSADHNHLCIQPIFQSHLFKICFDFIWYIMMFIFLHWSKNSLGKNFTTLKSSSWITSYIDLQICWFVLAMFSMSKFIVSWYSKVFLSYYIVTNLSLFLWIHSFYSAFSSAPSIFFSSAFSSYYVFPVTLSWFS